MKPFFLNSTEINIPKVKIIIYWNGFNSCALITNSLSSLYANDEILIITNDSYSSFEYVKSLSKFNFLNETCIDELYSHDFRNLILFVQTGWFNKRINKLGLNFKMKYGCKIYVTVDNIIKNNFRQFLGRIYIKYFFDKNVDNYLVPGIESLKLLVKFGVASVKIHTGFYGAYEHIYYPKKHEFKENIILYVGEISKRKGSDILLDIFCKINCPNWKLVLIGAVKDVQIYKNDNIVHYDFLAPNLVSEHMQLAKIFVLPSRLDHWGTVVCEAAMCGCALIVSSNAGAAYDLVDQGINGYITFTNDDLLTAINKTISWDNNKFIIASNWSIQKSELFKSFRYFNSIN
jgi:glycosyltransferase involved in cell wall biosynthesis